MQRHFASQHNTQEYLSFFSRPMDRWERPNYTFSSEADMCTFEYCGHTKRRYRLRMVDRRYCGGIVPRDVSSSKRSRVMMTRLRLVGIDDSVINAYYEAFYVKHEPKQGVMSCGVMDCLCLD